MSRYNIHIKNNRISNTWWGQAWTKNIDLYSDVYSRLERGRTYVRKGTIEEIEIDDNNIFAKVKGSRPVSYDIQIKIEKMPDYKCDDFYAKITSKIENISQLNSGVVPADLKEMFSAASSDGLFPGINEISFECSCPDTAIMCKHIAAVLYGIGNILDSNPLLIFQFRGIKLQKVLDDILIEKCDYYLDKAENLKEDKKIIEDSIEEASKLFGIELLSYEDVNITEMSRNKPEKINEQFSLEKNNNVIESHKISLHNNPEKSQEKMKNLNINTKYINKDKSNQEKPKSIFSKILKIFFDENYQKRNNKDHEQR